MLFDVLILAIFMIALLACQWLGYRLWIRRYEPGLSGQARILMALVILTLSGGFIGAFDWWADIPGGFAWDIPPLAGRFLASASWSFALLSFLTLLRPNHQRVRLFLWMLGVYMWPLTAAILAFHLDRFDFSAPLTYAFFAVVILLCAGSAWYLFLQPAIAPKQLDATAPTSRTFRAWLGSIAVITGLWGLALFITDDGPLRLVWPWPGDLLTSRLIATMLFSICAAAVYGLRWMDSARVVLGVITVYGAGLMVASMWNLLTAKPVNPAYLVTFGLFALGSSLLLATHRQTVAPNLRAG